MKIAYLDIETNYVGKHQDKRLFSDHKNHLITVLGVRLLNREIHDFVQLVDREVSKQKLLQILRGVTRIVTHNCPSIPDQVQGLVRFYLPANHTHLWIGFDRDAQQTHLVPLSRKCTHNSL